MKIIVTFILTFLAFTSEAKGRIILPIDSVSHKVTFDTVIQAPNKNKEFLYSQLNEWIALKYRSAKDVIQLNDKENGIIIVKGIFANIEFAGLAGNRDVLHSITFKIKDGKMRVIITDMANDFGSNGIKDIENEITGSGWTSTLLPKQQISFQESLKLRIMSTFKSISDKLNESKKDW
jgi:hypothetical protein